MQATLPVRIVTASREDEPHRPLEENIVPDPVDQHEELVPESDQVHDVDNYPDEPCEKTPEVAIPDSNHRRVPADGDHCALVAVFEGKRL